MNTPPVSLPAEHIPPGTAAWRSADARVWLSAVPARWAHPLWATVGLAGGAVWFMESGPEPSCTPASPCGVQDWLGFGLLTVLLLTFYWLWRQPRLALAGLGCVAAALVVDEVATGGGSLAEPSWAGFVLALAFAAAGALHRLGAAARQHALALAAAGPTTARLPRPPTRSGAEGCPSPWPPSCWPWPDTASGRRVRRPTPTSSVRHASPPPPPR
ncbi:hypothetical protein [Streptomyces sp. CC210A]|uniref:hypothetical protein n=1 Tax=Streptomyces sp. CC210A TaxID=2898184 RepID=UPI0027E4E5A0|nr:hypothetical protein [Streptomyces sp. CC210A]